MSDLLTTSIPQYAVPIVDNNGCITRPWLYFLLGLKSQASVITEIIGITDIAPKSLVANTGTVAGVPSSLAISNDLTITNGSTPELEIEATIARTAQTLALNNTGTVAQVVQGPVDYAGPMQISSGVYYSGSYNWVGGPNVNQSNRQNYGYNGIVSIGGAVTAATATIVSGTYNSTTGFVTLTLSSTINVLSDTFVTISGVTGTGSFAVLNGNQITGPGTSGTTLTFTVATGLTMTITGGNASQDITGANLFEEVVVDNWNAAPGGNGNIWTATHIAASGIVGGRQTVTQNLNVVAPTGNASVGSASYVTTTINAGASGNDGGTSLTPHGSLFSLVTTMQLGGSCTYWTSGVGYEMDINVGAGASVEIVYGLHVCTTAGHAVNGSLDDIAIHISGAGSSQSAYWKVGIGFGANAKNTAFGPSSTLIKVFPDISSGTLTVENFIDLTPSTVTVTGNVLIAQGATITGQGAATFAAFNLPTVSTAPTSVPTNGQIVFNTASKKINVGSGGSWYSSAALTLGSG